MASKSISPPVQPKKSKLEKQLGFDTDSAFGNIISNSGESHVEIFYVYRLDQEAGGLVVPTSVTVTALTNLMTLQWTQLKK